LHYQKSLTKDTLMTWHEREEEAPCEDVPDLFESEIKALIGVLNGLGYVELKGAN
jgi:hypothetical protein